MARLKLFMLLLGCKPLARHTEQHDVFFGIAPTLKELIPAIKRFWPEGDAKIHIDAWREVTSVDGHSIDVTSASNIDPVVEQPRLFFINLGGYQKGLFDEAHFKVLTVQPDKASAFKNAKGTDFYKQIRFDGAESHIDDKYGVGVDDLYEIDEILPEDQKKNYHIAITEDSSRASDEIHLGYFKLGSL